MPVSLKGVAVVQDPDWSALSRAEQVALVRANIEAASERKAQQ